jgi:hypothetical protein
VGKTPLRQLARNLLVALAVTAVFYLIFLFLYLL